jgi:hypothetical protein
VSRPVACVFADGGRGLSGPAIVRQAGTAVSYLLRRRLESGGRRTGMPSAVIAFICSRYGKDPAAAGRS